MLSRSPTKQNSNLQLLRHVFRPSSHAAYRSRPWIPRNASPPILCVCFYTSQEKFDKREAQSTKGATYTSIGWSGTGARFFALRQRSPMKSRAARRILPCRRPECSRKAKRHYGYFCAETNDGNASPSFRLRLHSSRRQRGKTDICVRAFMGRHCSSEKARWNAFCPMLVYVAPLVLCASRFCD